MFKWLKRLLGTEIDHSVNTPSDAADTTVPAAPVVAVAATAPVEAEAKPKRIRAKKSTAESVDAKPKRTARSTPPKQAKVSK